MWRTVAHTTPQGGHMEKQAAPPTRQQRERDRAAAAGLLAVSAALHWKLQGSTTRPMPCDFADAVAAICHAAEAQGYEPEEMLDHGREIWEAQSPQPDPDAILMRSAVMPTPQTEEEVLPG